MNQTSISMIRVKAHLAKHILLNAKGMRNWKLTKSLYKVQYRNDPRAFRCATGHLVSTYINSLINAGVGPDDVIVTVVGESVNLDVNGSVIDESNMLLLWVILA